MKQASKWTLTLLALIVVGAALAVGCGVGSDNPVGAQEELVRPTVVPANALTPAPTPADGRQVAILDLVIVSDPEGTIERVQLERARIINSFAPNVLGLAGPWTVELVGEQTVRFGTLDPREVRVYDEQDEVPHSTSLAETTTWELVVPLYDNDRDLQVRVINIYDENEELIFTTEVDRDAWQEAAGRD